MATTSSLHRDVAGFTKCSRLFPDYAPTGSRDKLAVGVGWVDGEVLSVPQLTSGQQAKQELHFHRVHRELQNGHPEHSDAQNTADHQKATEEYWKGDNKTDAA